MRSSRALVALALAALPGVAAAAEVGASSRIDAIVVFPQGAEVTRIATLGIPLGQHVVVIKDLPAGLLADSIRVQGEATAKLEIGAVDTREIYLSQEENTEANAALRKRLETELETLSDRRLSLVNAITAAETQKSLIVNLAGLPVRPEPQQGGGNPRSATEWGEIFGLIGVRIAETNKVIEERQREVRTLDRKIADVQNELSREPGQEDARTEVKVNVLADAALEATLRIKYQVPSAFWSPLYDARLETGSEKEGPRLVVVRRAVISQSSGEDWKDVSLALSTTRPQAGTAAPELYPLIVDFVPDEKPVPLAKYKRDDGVLTRMTEVTGGASGDAAEAPASAAPEPVQSVEQRSTIVNAPFQATYVITDRQTVASGDGNKRVQIDLQSTDAVLTVRSVPRVTDVAFLYAKMKLGPDVMLLPGPASLFRDGVFVGQGSLPLLPGGEEHELGFGTDDKIKITFATLAKETTETGIISTSKTETQEFKITVKSLHSRALPVRVVDQMPVSENEKIEVAMTSGSLKPSLINVEDKRGILAWDLTLDPDESETIPFGYAVTWPRNQEIVYQYR